MAVTYGFFDSLNGDRKYNAQQMSEFYNGIVNNGVFQHVGSGMAVSAGTGLNVSVAAGRAIIQNHWVKNDAALTVAVPAASSTYARIDAVVIRYSTTNRSIVITIKEGTAAASPSAPSLTRNDTTYEMALAYVNVAANASSVTVTDKRSDTTLCGWVSVAQSTSGEVDAQLNAMKTGFDGVVYSSPAAMVNSCDEKIVKAVGSATYTSDHNLPIGFYSFNISDLAVESGSISGTGQDAPATNRARTSKYCFYESAYLVSMVCASGYSASAVIYDNGGNFLQESGWQSGGVNIWPTYRENCLVRFIIRKTDNSTITPSEAASAVSSIKIYKDDISAFQAIRATNNGLSIPVQFAVNRSVANVATTKRASSGFFPFYDDFIVYSDTTNDLCKVFVVTYDDSLSELTEYSGSAAFSISMKKEDNTSAKFFRIYLCDMASGNNDLPASSVAFANEHIKILYGNVAYNLDDLSIDDLKLGTFSGQSNYDYYAYADTRLVCEKIFINDGRLVNVDFEYGRISVRFFNSNFEYVANADVDYAEYIDLSVYNYPYFGITLRDRYGNVITSESKQSIFDNFHRNSKAVRGYTISGANGQMQWLGNLIRCATPKYIEINDAYIKGFDVGFDYGIAIYNKNKEFQYAIDWYTYSTEFGMTDKAIRLQDCLIRFYFAKEGDRTSAFSISDYNSLESALESGSFIEIIESVNFRSIGTEIKNGFPFYYEEEMANTINSLCSKVGADSVVFAMLTDLHDNDHYHYSETLAYQINAARRIKDKSRIDFTLCGGDLTDGGYSSKSVLLDKMTEHKDHFSQIGTPVLFMRGNHDDNSYYSKVASNCISRDEFFQRMIMNETGSTISDGKTYYYYDFEEVNTRVIVLDFIDYEWQVDESGNLVNYAAAGDGVWRGYSESQIAWFAGEALNTNKKIVVVGHYSTHPNLMTTWEKEHEHNYEEIRNAMIAYQSKGTYTFGGVTYNYSEKTGKILVQVSGHSHAFGAFEDDGIIWSTTGSVSTEATHRVFDNTQYETMGPREYGKIIEAHFNIFVCDSDNVHIISFGQMGDLNFEI